MCILASCNKDQNTSLVATSRTNSQTQAGKPLKLPNPLGASGQSNAPLAKSKISATPALDQTTNALPPAEGAVELYNLGVRHFQGDGVPKSPSEAAKYFHEAADLGHPGAQHNLAILYLTGSGVTNDPAEAAQWLSKSAERGLAESQFKLASFYATGLGVTQDVKLAAQWVRKAADQGHTEA